MVKRVSGKVGHGAKRGSGGHTDHVCGVCAKKFTTAQHRDNHEKTVHEGIKAYGCGVCGQMFATAWHRDHHEKKMHQDVKLEEVAEGVKLEEDSQY